jgi:hypothetical protein
MALTTLPCATALACDDPIFPVDSSSCVSSSDFMSFFLSLRAAKPRFNHRGQYGERGSASLYI